MVSRRNFIVITAMLLVVLFLFQMIAVVRESWNDYETNQYADTSDSAFGQTDAWGAEEKPPTSGEYSIVFVGDEKEGAGPVVSQWSVYAKKKILKATSLSPCMSMWQTLEVLIIDSRVLSFERDTPTLQWLADQGVSIIFCNLPAPQTIRQIPELMELLGIRQVVMDEVQVTGYHLFSGFFLGGESWYQANTKRQKKRQDLDLEIPWYFISSGTKTYMVGTLEEDNEYLNPELKVEDRNELLPAILWRNSIGSARIFAVNGDFMSDETGIGLLTAMFYEMEEYSLYPVVNAQNLSVANGPVLAEENESRMQEIYSRSGSALFQDVIWPGIVAVGERGDWSTTCFLNPQMDPGDEEEPETEKLPDYLKLLKETSTEVGFSGDTIGDEALGERLQRDSDLLVSTGSRYAYRSLYLPEKELEAFPEDLKSYAYLKELRTVVTDPEPSRPLLSVETGDLTVQCATADGFRHTFSDDIRLKSLQTAFGYSHILLNLERVFWPEDEEDQWEKLSEEFSSNVLTYWAPFSAFDHTSVSQSDQRIRRFLALDYTQERKKNEIILQISNFEEEAWFLLRTHGEEIVKIKGATFVEVEKDAWLLHMEEEKAVIQVKSRQKLTYPNE